MARKRVDPTTLMGTLEIGAHLGVSRQAVTNWHRRGKFIPPLATLSQGPIWCRDDVDAWAASPLSMLREDSQQQ